VRCFVSNKLIIIFIDGVGIGKLDPAYNPCCFSETGIFNSRGSDLPGGGVLYPLDAQLGIPGFPQSATGHTTIYTGINAPALIEKHLFGFPNARLKLELRERSLFVILSRMGIKCKFINAFRPLFFTTPELFKNKNMSATTEMNKYAGLPFSDFSQIKNHKALYHEYTNENLISLGFDLPIFSARQAAEILISESRSYDVILYEFFMTDFAGHRQDMKQAIKQIHSIEILIMDVIRNNKFFDTTVLVVSDHGNIEDLRKKSHTNNPAYSAIWWAKQIKERKAPTSLKDINPLVLSLFSE
jgi:predicted AlkP superfamily pyrophosphatase or phosphodiesterase